MADIYLPTGDDGVVTKQTEVSIELQQLINQYISLRDEWLNRPERKTVPDIEAMDAWNAEFDQQDAQIRFNIKQGAFQLYLKVQPIYLAGLLPARFEDEYLQLEIFANNP